MASRTLPNVGLKGFWNLGEDGWKDEMDRNLLLISVLAQGGVISKVSATPGAPSDGDVHIFDETHGTQPNKIAIRDAAGWTYITPQEGWLVYNRGANYFEKFDGTVWAELSTGVTQFADLTDVDMTGIADGDVPVWDAGTNKFLPGAGGGGGSSTLAGLTDVDTTGVADGDSLTYDSATSTWVPAAVSGGGGGVSTLGPGYNRTLATAAALTTAGFAFNYGGTSLVDGTPGVRAAGDARIACAFGSYTTLTIFGTDCQIGFTETANNGKYVIQYNVGNGRWIFGRINAGGGYNSDGTQYSGFYGYSRTGNPTWMRARYSGGTMYFGLSSNGDTWNEWGTEGTGFLTPTRFHVALGDLHYFALS